MAKIDIPKIDKDPHIEKMNSSDNAFCFSESISDWQVSKKKKSNQNSYSKIKNYGVRR